MRKKFVRGKEFPYTQTIPFYAKSKLCKKLTKAHKKAMWCDSRKLIHTLLDKKSNNMSPYHGLWRKMSGKNIRAMLPMAK